MFSLIETLAGVQKYVCQPSWRDCNVNIRLLLWRDGSSGALTTKFWPEEPVRGWVLKKRAFEVWFKYQRELSPITLSSI